jgi:inorganic pyrophosphatase
MNIFQQHPWHGVEIGAESPKIVTAFIEIVPTDTIKYEVDKASGWLKIDRPQLYSNRVPAMYGFIPQTYCGHNIAQTAQNSNPNISIKNGDGDPLDILVLSENVVSQGGILLKAKPIGGFCMIDKGEADDKIIAVLLNDAQFGDIQDINELPEKVIQRIKHYFMTYKNLPNESSQIQLTNMYNRDAAYNIIRQSVLDYKILKENKL